MQSLHDYYWSIHNDVTPPTTRRVPITLSSICSLKYSHRALLGEQSFSQSFIFLHSDALYYDLNVIHYINYSK